MQFFMYNFRLQLQLILHRKSSIFLLLLPILCLAISGKISQDELQVSLPVGIVIPENSQSGERLYSLLRHEDGLVEYQKMDSQTLRQKVAVGDLACGFILDNDFDSHIEKGRYKGLFTAVMTEDSTAGSLVSEAISAAMLSLVAEDIAIDFLADRDIEAHKNIFDESASRIEIIAKFVGDDGGKSAQNAVITSAVDGIFATAMTIFAVAFSAKIQAWRGSVLYRRMRAIEGDFALTMPILLAFATVVFALALISYFAMGTLEILPILALVLALICVAELFSRMPRELVILTMPFLAVLMLIICPIFVNLGAVSRICKAMSQIFPATHFMRMMAGSGGYFAIIILSFCCISIAYIFRLCYNRYIK